MSLYARPVPVPTPETLEFWLGTKRGELILQRCAACSTVVFPPRGFCPACWSTDLASFAASGRGRLHTYVINYLPVAGFEDEPPYAIAIVELDEGPRLMSWIVETEQDPESLTIDMPLEAVFEDVSDEAALPKFRPVTP